MTQQIVRLDSDNPVVIPLSTEGGALNIAYSQPLAGGRAELGVEPHILDTAVWREDLLGSGFLLAYWAGLNGEVRSAGALRVPMLEAGSYTVCSSRTMRTQTTQIGATCVEGFIPSSGELNLVIPENP